MSRTLFLAWQDQYSGPEGQPATRQWFPIGKLDIEQHGALRYRFRYTRGAERARKAAGFQPLDAFPVLDKDYRSKELFPLFRNRVPDVRRGDYKAMLERLALSEQADPFEILAVSGGNRQTDNLEVFPKMGKRSDGGFTSRFFLHGWRHVSEPARRHIQKLQSGELLRVAVELNNPASGVALQLESADDYMMLGWAPRYLVEDLLKAVTEAPADLRAHVVRVNPPPAPHNQRVLIELCGHLPADHEPMSSQQFEPLVA